MTVDEAWKFLIVQGRKKVLEELEREDEVKRGFVSEGETRRGTFSVSGAVIP